MTVIDLIKKARDSWSTILFWIGVTLLAVSIAYGFIWPFFAGVWIGLPKMIEHIASSGENRAIKEKQAFDALDGRLKEVERHAKEQQVIDRLAEIKSSTTAQKIAQEETFQQLHDRVMRGSGTDD